MSSFEIAFGQPRVSHFSHQSRLHFELARPPFGNPLEPASAAPLGLPQIWGSTLNCSVPEPLHSWWIIWRFKMRSHYGTPCKSALTINVFVRV